MHPPSRSGRIQRVLVPSAFVIEDRAVFDFFHRVSRSMLVAERRWKIALALSTDVVCAIFAVLFSFSVRLGYWQFFTKPVTIFLTTQVALFVPIFLAVGLYSSLFRFHGPRGFRQLSFACALLTIPTIVIFGVFSYPGVPRTLSVLFPVFFFVLVALARVVARFALLDLFGERSARRNVLIYGAGNAGRQLADLLRHESEYRLVGFVDDDAVVAGRRLEGLMIYQASELEAIIQSRAVEIVFLAMPSLKRIERARLADRLQQTGVHLQLLPAVSELVDGRISLSDLREIDVMDLLSRDPVEPDQKMMAEAIEGKTVLVTGAGGSIGAELVRQVVRLNPAVLVLLEMTEASLYAIELEAREIMQDSDLSFSIVAELASVEKNSSVQRIFRKYRPQTVYHAAAYKHVPLVEANVVSGTSNNIGGTRNCVQAACEIGSERFILVSTDKAVRPTNVMGASKRVCEMICQAMAATPNCSTIISMVRFGNVLGSSGSVVPRFQRQIAEGGPVSVTHREMTRYFMTIPEAAALVIQAGAMAKGGEVYLLDMGEPVKILDLALAMIRLSGRTVKDANNPDGDVAIQVTGLRPGEKLYEELLIDAKAQGTEHGRIFRANESFLPWHQLEEELEHLDMMARTGEVSAIRAKLVELVPEFVSGQSAVRA